MSQLTENMRYIWIIYQPLPQSLLAYLDIEESGRRN